MHEKQRLFGLVIDFNVVCEYSKSGLPFPCAGRKGALTQLDVYSGVLGTVDSRAGGDVLWVLPGVKR